MRALVVTPPGVPEITEVEPPAPTPGTVLLQAIAATLNPVDVAVSEGFFHQLGWIARPTVGLGWDVVGEVIAVGDGVDSVAPGDIVAALYGGVDKEVGAVAEQVVVPADSIAAVPAGLDPVTAATIGLNAQTARQGLALLGTERGSLLITGAAGSVGGYAIQLAVDLGFAVTGLARPADRSFVESTGARFTDRVVRTYDAVFDAADLADEGLRAVRDGGRYIGVVPAREAAAETRIDVQAVLVRPDGAELAELLALAAANKLILRVSEKVGLDDAPDSVAHLSDGGRRGAVVVTY
ncbi:MAG: NADP-dependent oxidoreductase [Gordonia amarae]